MLAYYRRLIAWRRGQDALVDGDIEFFNVAEPVLAFRRMSSTGNLLCIFNLSPQPEAVTLAGLADDALPEPLSERASRKGRMLALGPNGFAFIAEPVGAGTVVRTGRKQQKPGG